MKNLKLVIVLFICWSFGGCYYDKEEEIYPTIECSTEDMSFQADILPIITNNCYSCHDAANNFGGITLEGYDKLIAFVNNDQLIGAIKHSSGFSPMPKNAAQLLECEIEKIEAWITNGALDN